MGNPADKHPHHRTRPVAQLIGEDYFTLVEATPRPMAQLDIGERVYIGPIAELRTKISRVDGEIEYEDLTTFARGNLRTIVEKIVVHKEPVFVMFFNIAEPISIRFHSLELLPGIGKRILAKIIEYREKKPFESFEEIRAHTHIDPVKVVVERIIEELSGNQKYYLFVKPPRKAREQLVQPMYLDYLGRIYQATRSRHSGEKHS